MPRVIYNGLIADVTEEDLQSGVSCLAASSPSERQQILASVRSVLDEVLNLVAAGKQDFSAKQLQDIANDIGIWFAGEVLAGTSEQYKVAVQ